MTARTLMSNPFEVLGLDPAVDLADDELEANYLRLSRECHPDFHRSRPAEEQVLVLTQSAELNSAYRTLRDPWLRAETVISIADAEAMEVTKTLCPMFLMEAMEMREAVTDAAAEDWPGLRQDLDAKVREYFAEIASHVAAGEVREAATLLHQSNYYRKALSQLKDRIHTPS